MEQIYKLIRRQISPELTTLMAKQLGSDAKQVEHAVSSIFTGFLVLTRMNGNTLQIRNIFEEAGSLNFAARYSAICTEPLTPEARSVGDNFLQHVLGDRAANFTSWISMQVGMSEVIVNTLIAILAPVYVGYIGDKIVSNRWSPHKVFGLISMQEELNSDFYF